MTRPTRIHKDKQPIRFHYIREWASHRKMRQADIARELSVDKSTVSRWFKGSVPVEDHLIALAGLLEAEEPAALFRHPDDDWLTRFFRFRNEVERHHAVRVLKAAFEKDAA